MAKANIYNTQNDLISMILGLGVVIIILITLFNFVIRARGNISVPGVSTNVAHTPLTTPGVVNTVNNINKYEVKAGDSLWKIAKNQLGDGNLWTKIASENNIKNVSIIEVGKKLTIPKVDNTSDDIGTADQGKTEPKADTYQVVKGDSLWKIAISNYNNGYDWVKIWNLNRNVIRNPNLLEIGMVIKLR